MAIMPRLSDALRAERRRHVLDSAFRCFARTGFHATTVDDVVAETGWSSSVVYSYVRTKDEMVAAAVEEALAEFAVVLAGLLGRDPAPTPRETLQAFVDILDDDTYDRRYGLQGLVVHIWAEALGSREVGDRARRALAVGRRRLTTLTGRMEQAGTLPPSMTPDDGASLLLLVIFGVIVDQTHLGGAATEGALHRLEIFEP
ncbi:Transcriptional regulator, TetR family [Pseudonocardia sp. Ae168_Ps1]|nr:Transcriptional regulator, TetR family [Pseudonocardia sp. Ae150A_Ps1]OLL82835.1 Transcriptional regulator, TetR family [Pseudonocardia sp. Ae168_Ps1]OLL83053.1 Transcriptional regulator, TetR family [Pseudonocardia sp. Ae263_Ps1]OLL90908.1 Transcriptional regulator, TetR family [Pseudonocardia sp. Ae356_Ps1]